MWAAASLSMALLAGAVVAGPGQAEDPDLGWPPVYFTDVGPGSGRIGFHINDKFSHESVIRVPSPGDQPECITMEDPECAIPAEKYGWWILRAAPPCVLAIPREECVESLAVTSGEGQPRESRLIGLAPGKRQFSSDPERGLPTGSAMSLWTDPYGSDDKTGYAVDLSGQMGGREGPFQFNTFAAQVYRYRIGPPGAMSSCVWSTQTSCAYRIAFPEGSSLKLTLLMNNSLSGWLSGRLQQPTVSVEAAGRGLDRISIEALPVDVPMVAVDIPVAEATPAILAHWRTGTCPGNKPCEDGVGGVESDGPDSAKLLRLFARHLGDTATKLIPTWSIASMNASIPPSPCLASSDSLVGLVTTNATVYDSGPPAFVDSSLRYSVAGLHRVPSGDVLRGTYDLVLSSDAARCLYGFGKAPIRAEIQVISEDGVEQVVTTAVSERKGWLRLSAYGFTFSEPTISIRLTSDEKLTTITCKKGKKTKKVTGVKPKCPPGWRQVRG